MARVKRKWHKKFIKYMNFIVKHPNYTGMPEAYKADGSIRWVTSGKGEIGQKRLKWWDKKRKELKIEKEGPWISKVARAIHPTGLKPCQICGKEMSLDYIYPNKRSGFSPGAMSNAPDRFDGYHTYNLCCRSTQDTGRHKDNLNRYGEDRRAYENWADGDWKAASWLMKVFNKHRVSPDHIGPISLGFSHNPKFNPLTPAKNSAKNNRMTYADVKDLIKLEKKGASVVSWHSKYIWDLLKNKIKNDSDALRLSKIMRKNLHQILIILAEISSNGYDQFLVSNFLHPEYAYFSISFKDFNPKDGSYKEMTKIPGKKKQYKNNAKRYIRISLESLAAYREVKNRNTQTRQSKKVRDALDKTLLLLKNKHNAGAKKSLYKVCSILSKESAKNY
ncbi:MAG: hypothetical protein ABH881_02555 [bacterium]